MGTVLVFLGVIGIIALRTATKDMTEANAFIEWWPLWLICAAALMGGSWLAKRDALKITQNKGKK